MNVSLRWSTADERALEEAVVRAKMGLLFVGVKTYHSSAFLLFVRGEKLTLFLVLGAEYSNQVRLDLVIGRTGAWPRHLA